MARVVERVKLRQSSGHLWELPGRCAHEVETAHEDIRSEVGSDVEDAAVGAAAEENASAVFLDEEVELVPEIIGHADSATQGAHAGSWRRIRLRT